MNNGISTFSCKLERQRKIVASRDKYYYRERCTLNILHTCPENFAIKNACPFMFKMKTNKSIIMMFFHLTTNKTMIDLSTSYYNIINML